MPLVFGEALFDHFPDGSRVLGGAPFNVAWHLQGFKGRPLMVTAVGTDREGEEILAEMGKWGMETSGVQLHPTRPTGRVTAHLEGGQPRYDIEAGQAYDSIRIEALPDPDRLEPASLLYHGTLGSREETSRRTLDYLRTTLDVPTFIDVNLRDPWWSVEGVFGLLEGATWVKASREEMNLLSEVAEDDPSSLIDLAHTFRRRIGVDVLIVTSGIHGSLAVTKDGSIEQGAQGVGDTVDTVGAGDAFTAVMVLGLQNGWSLDMCLRRASEFAGEICRIRGAIPSESDLYSRYLWRWNRA